MNETKEIPGGETHVKVVKTKDPVKKIIKSKPKVKKAVKAKPSAKPKLHHCAYKGCVKMLGGRKKWCEPHKKIVRKRQLKLNNVTYRKRKAKKGWQPKQPHLMYGKRLTKWTVKNRQRAEKVAKQRGTKLEAKLFAK